MSDIICPFCGKRLDAVVKNQNDWIYSCGNPSCEFFDDCDNYEQKHYLATPEFWQELIRTRKALDVATGFIKGISQTIINDCDNQYVVLGNFKKFAQDTLEKITALEQKLTIGKTKYEYPTNAMLMDKINELVDAVNELKEKQ